MMGGRGSGNGNGGLHGIAGAGAGLHNSGGNSNGGNVGPSSAAQGGVVQWPPRASGIDRCVRRGCVSCDDICGCVLM
jgi:hypothetical protein